MRTHRREQLVKHFSDGARPYAELYRGASPISYLLSTRLKIVHQLLGDLSAVWVLDVGCGPGMTAGYFTCNGCHWFGLDLSTEMLDACKQRFGSTRAVHLSAGTIERLPFPDGTFDVVLGLGVIEYVDDADVAINELARVAKDGAAMIVSMLNKRCPYRLWNQYVYHGQALDYVRRLMGRPATTEPELQLLSLSDMRTLLSTSHLQVTDTVYYDYNLWLPPLDRYFPRPSVNTSQQLEFLSDSPLRGLGTGYLVKAIINKLTK